MYPNVTCRELSLKFFLVTCSTEPCKFVRNRLQPPKQTYGTQKKVVVSWCTSISSWRLHDPFNTVGSWGFQLDPRKVTGPWPRLVKVTLQGCEGDGGIYRKILLFICIYMYIPCVYIYIRYIFAYLRFFCFLFNLIYVNESGYMYTYMLSIYLWDTLNMSFDWFSIGSGLSFKGPSQSSPSWNCKNCNHFFPTHFFWWMGFFWFSIFFFKWGIEEGSWPQPHDEHALLQRLSQGAEGGLAAFVSGWWFQISPLFGEDSHFQMGWNRQLGMLLFCWLVSFLFFVFLKQT